MSRLRARRRGFTLIELVAAAALASLLLAALAGVAGSFVRSARRAPAESDTSLWQGRLAEQIRWDFERAREVRRTPQFVALRGYGDLGAGSSLTTKPVEVVYRIETCANRSWLTRTQSPLGVASSASKPVELLAVDVGSLDWQAEDPEAPQQPQAARRGASAWALPPKRSRFRLLGLDQKSVVLDTVIYLP